MGVLGWVSLVATQRKAWHPHQTLRVGTRTAGTWTGVLWGWS